MVKRDNVFYMDDLNNLNLNMAKNTVTKGGPVEGSADYSFVDSDGSGSGSGSGFNSSLWGSLGSAALQVGSNAMTPETGSKETLNQDKYGYINKGMGEDVMGNIPVWGGIVKAAMQVNASGVKYNEDGAIKSNYFGQSGKDARKTELAYQAGTDWTRLYSEVDNNQELYDQYGFSKGDNVKMSVANAIAPMAASGLFGSTDKFADVQEKMANDRKVSREKRSDLEDVYNTGQKKLKKSKDLYDAVSSHSYVGAAKKGSKIIVPYEYKRIVLPKIDTQIKSLKKGGAFHHTKNKLGDNGIPVVDKNGVKVVEIEINELVAGKEFSEEVDMLRYKFKQTGDEKYLKEIGVLTKKELLENTYSYTEEFSCLNDNSCSLNK